jgi:hypothetical protein
MPKLVKLVLELVVRVENTVAVVEEEVIIISLEVVRTVVLEVLLALVVVGVVPITLVVEVMELTAVLAVLMLSLLFLSMQDFLEVKAVVEAGVLVKVWEVMGVRQGLVVQLLQVFLPSKPIKVMEQEVQVVMVVMVPPTTVVLEEQVEMVVEQQVFV